MYKLSKYSKNFKISIIVLMSLLIIFPISGIILDLCDRMINYSIFKPGPTGHSQYSIDQLIAWLFVAFTNWYAMYCAIYGVVFLARLGYKNEKSEFKKFIFNCTFLAMYSVVIVLVFWPDVLQQLFVGKGFIFTNSLLKNFITVNIHFITPVIAFALFGIFSYYEEQDFKYFIKRISYFVLLLPVLYIAYSWIRLVIYVEHHGYSPTDRNIVWWNSYKILNPYINPVWAPVIAFSAGIAIYGLSILLAYLATLSLKVKKDKKSKPNHKVKLNKR